MKKYYLPMRSLTAIALTTTFMVFSCKSELDEPLSPDRTASNARFGFRHEFVSNEVLVKFTDGTDEDNKSRAYGRVRGQVSEDIYTRAMSRAGRSEGIKVLAITGDVAEAIEALQAMPGVELAEPNYVYQHTAVSNDTYFTNGSLWGMYGASTSPANQYGSNAAAAWAVDKTGSASVLVGIVDEGIQITHPDLDANIWVNPFDPVNGVDDDGNGYRDDKNGWDFANNDNTVYDGGTRGSLDDHGTHVAGTIGAERNGTGVAGVNWNVKMISAKFLGRNGGTTANAIKAVDYLTDLKTRHGINVVASNNSWGGGGFSQALYDAISRANNAGVLFVAAAGNSGTNNDTSPGYPANYDLPNVIAVAAITNTGALASFSQYGLTTVDLGAPGAGVWSSTAFSIYSSYSGTSMATPHVTGAVALYKSVNPGATAAQIKAAILNSAVATPSLNGKTVTGGRLDVNAALSF
ncbi:MAG: S8 family serine peptidase [Cytophagaceae bacterium]|nr:S8 family serine peptidase [Cytophagaceae bacterium]